MSVARTRFALVVLVASVCLPRTAFALRPYTPSHEVMVVEGQNRVAGIFFPAGTALDVSDSDGSVVSAELGADAAFDNQRYRRGSILHFSGSRVDQVTLVHPQAVHGVDFQASTVIFFSDRALIDTAMPKDQGARLLVQGVVFDDSATFHANERVKEGTLAIDQFVGNGFYRAKTQLTFHSNGQVAEGVLGAGQAINGVLVRGSSGIRFYESGQIEGAWLSEPQVIQDRACQGSVWFYRGGRLRYLTLAAETDCSGTKCTTGDGILLNEQGRFAELQSVPGPYPDGTQVVAEPPRPLPTATPMATAALPMMTTSVPSAVTAGSSGGAPSTSRSILAQFATLALGALTGFFLGKRSSRRSRRSR